MSRLRTGQLTYFHRSFLSKKWKDGYFVLYEDSTIQCFEKQNDRNTIYSVRLKDVCNYLSVGPFTRCVPGRPALPPRGDENLLICFPKDSQRKVEDICWIICHDLTQLNDWMSAITKTLPPPPQLSQKNNPNAPPNGQQNQNVNPSAPPQIRFNTNANDSVPPAPQYIPAQPQQTSYGGGYGGGAGYKLPPQQATGGGGTNIVIQPSNPVVVTGGGYGGYGYGGRYSETDLALGMLAGAAMSGGLGYTFGHGWGCGSGWGGHWGHYDCGDTNYYNDGPDYTVNNYTVNNYTYGDDFGDGDFGGDGDW